MEEKQLKYYKMHHDLQEQIRLGMLQSGDRVPSENQLAAAYQVSRQTVRKALAILEQEGYIYAVHGKGTFVSERVRPEHKSHNIAVVTTCRIIFSPGSFRASMKFLRHRGTAFY